MFAFSWSCLKMFSLLVIMCLLCIARPADIRPSQRETRDDIFMVDELFNTKDDDWKDRQTLEYDRSESRIPRIWNNVQDMTSHRNPCRFKTKEWKTTDYLNQKKYDFQPDLIRVKHCIGASNSRIVTQGCRKIMDCVTQYERRRFIRKLKGAPCSQWHIYEKEIPVGCECMMAT